MPERSVHEDRQNRQVFVVSAKQVAEIARVTGDEEVPLVAVEPEVIAEMSDECPAGNQDVRREDPRRRPSLTVCSPTRGRRGSAAVPTRESSAAAVSDINALVRCPQTPRSRDANPGGLPLSSVTLEDAGPWSSSCSHNRPRAVERRSCTPARPWPGSAALEPGCSRRPDSRGGVYGGSDYNSRRSTPVQIDRAGVAP